MPTPEIIEHVKKLRAELGEAPTDPKVDALRAQVDQVLAEPDREGHYRTLGDRISALETDHPKLAATMQALIDTLAKAGI